MNAGALSTWDKIQLTLLRWLSVVLAVMDGLLEVTWGERLSERLTHRWRAQLAELDRALVELEEERGELQEQAEALAIHTAALYLGRRYLAEKELRFDPADAHDENLLDASIDLLVKERLAEIESEEIAPGHYVYHLEPDWAAIHTHLSQAANGAEPEIAGWYREGLRFISDTFL